MYELYFSIYIFTSLCIVLGSGCSIIAYEKNKQETNEEDNDGARGPSLPFLGSSFVQRLMGEKRYLFGDWERAQFQEKRLGKLY